MSLQCVPVGVNVIAVSTCGSEYHCSEYVPVGVNVIAVSTWRSVDGTAVIRMVIKRWLLAAILTKIPGFSRREYSDIAKEHGER